MLTADKGDRTPESDEEVYFASKHALRQELIDMRFAPQEAGKVNSMHKVRMKYAEGGKDSATDIEVRHSDFYHVSPEEWQEAFERQQRKERR